MQNKRSLFVTCAPPLLPFNIALWGPGGGVAILRVGQRERFFSHLPESMMVMRTLRFLFHVCVSKCAAISFHVGAPLCASAVTDMENNKSNQKYFGFSFRFSVFSIAFFPLLAAAGF